MPKLTIGMAVYDDMIGVLDTIQDLRIHHAVPMRDVEIVVVDNHPGSDHGKDTEAFVTGYAHIGTAGAKYVPMSECQGTTQPRERVFRESSGDFVMCIDSHIKLMPGSLERLLEWLDAHPDCDDLWQGPMIYDCLVAQSTEMLDHWRGGMWGIWADLPHDDEPGDEYTVFAQGLGLFGCRREAWPGFHPEFREFGGEECYIHEKFRRLGRRCIGLRFLRWWHRFWQPSSAGRKYRRTTWGMARNYVLGHQELGLPLDRAYEHLARQRRSVTESQWQELVVDARNAQVPILVDPQPSAGPDLIAAMYDGIAEDGQAETVRMLSLQHEHVTIIGSGEWLWRATVAAAASRPRILHVYAMDNTDLAAVHRAVAACPERDGRRIEQLETTVVHDGAVPPIAQTGLLVAPHDYIERFEHRVTRRIVSAGAPDIPERWSLLGRPRGMYLFGCTAEIT